MSSTVYSNGMSSQRGAIDVKTGQAEIVTLFNTFLPPLPLWSINSNIIYTSSPSQKHRFRPAPETLRSSKYGTVAQFYGNTASRS